MLKDLLEKRQCFKLVCGAGNEDADDVEKLVAIYAKAGAQYFDLSAKPEIVKAAHKGLSRVIPEKDRGDYYMNVSVGIKGDPHVSKSVIDRGKCVACGACKKMCPQGAIIQSDNSYSVNRARCIGCGKCKPVCPQNAIFMHSEQKDLNEVLPPLIREGIDSIELHAVSDDNDRIFGLWNDVCNNFSGILSICTDRSHASDVELADRINKMIANRAPYTTIIQADGAPMSGGADDYETTLQAIATAQIVQRMKVPVFILLSGGTNSKSVELANQCGVRAHGVSIGTFGRNLIKEFIRRDDFWENKGCFDAAYEKAKCLVETCLCDLRAGV